MSTETITIEREEDWAVLTLNRPEVRNAINEQMVNEIHDALKEMEGDDTLGVLIITGAGGKAFAAGADIAQLLVDLDAGKGFYVPFLAVIGQGAGNRNNHGGQGQGNW